MFLVLVFGVIVIVLVSDVDVFVCMIWVEVCGEFDVRRGMVVVVYVVVNCVEKNSWWGCSIVDVCIYLW